MSALAIKLEKLIQAERARRESVVAADIIRQEIKDLLRDHAIDTPMLVHVFESGEFCNYLVTKNPLGGFDYERIAEYQDKPEPAKAEA